MNHLGLLPPRRPASGVVHTSLASAPVSGELSKPGIAMSHVSPAKCIGPVLAGGVLHDGSLCNKLRQVVSEHLAVIYSTPYARRNAKKHPSPLHHYPAITIGVGRVRLFASVSTNARRLASGIVPASLVPASSASGLTSPQRGRVLSALSEVTNVPAKFAKMAYVYHWPKVYIKPGVLQLAVKLDPSYASQLGEAIRYMPAIADLATVPVVPAEDQHALTDLVDVPAVTYEDQNALADLVDVPVVTAEDQHTFIDAIDVPPVTYEDQHALVDIVNVPAVTAEDQHALTDLVYVPAVAYEDQNALVNLVDVPVVTAEDKQALIDVVDVLAVTYENQHALVDIVNVPAVTAEDQHTFTDLVDVDVPAVNYEDKNALTDLVDVPVVTAEHQHTFIDAVSVLAVTYEDQYALVDIVSVPAVTAEDKQALIDVIDVPAVTAEDQNAHSDLTGVPTAQTEDQQLADPSVAPTIPTEDQQPLKYLDVDPCTTDTPDADNTTHLPAPLTTQEEPLQEVTPTTVSDSRPLTKSALRRLRRQRAEVRAAAAEGREPRNDHAVRKQRKLQKEVETHEPSTSPALLSASQKEEEPVTPSATGASNSTCLPSAQDLSTDSTKASPPPTIKWRHPIPPPKTVTAHDIEMLAAQLSRLRCDDRPVAGNVKQPR